MAKNNLDNAFDDWGFNEVLENPVEKKPIPKVEMVKEITGPINIVEKALNTKGSDTQKKTMYLLPEHIDWLEEEFYKFKKENKGAKEYHFMVYLIEKIKNQSF